VAGRRGVARHGFMQFHPPCSTSRLQPLSHQRSIAARGLPARRQWRPLHAETTRGRACPATWLLAPSCAHGRPTPQRLSRPVALDRGSFANASPASTRSAPASAGLTKDQIPVPGHTTWSAASPWTWKAGRVCRDCGPPARSRRAGCTGNRLASNSLLEGLVYGTLCARGGNGGGEDAGSVRGPAAAPPAVRRAGDPRRGRRDQSLRSLMVRKMGIMRVGPG
jgi:hypothetical protein